MQNADRISGEQRRSQRFSVRVPYFANTSMLPVSGACS
jgi:hypothetical protein